MYKLDLFVTEFAYFMIKCIEFEGGGGRLLCIEFHLCANVRRSNDSTLRLGHHLGCVLSKNASEASLSALWITRAQITDVSVNSTLYSDLHYRTITGLSLFPTTFIKPFIVPKGYLLYNI